MSHFIDNVNLIIMTITLNLAFIIHSVIMWMIQAIVVLTIALMAMMNMFLAMFITIIIIIPRQESYLNTVARTYMMELGAEMLESIRDEMLPLAEKWLPFDFHLLSDRSSLCYTAPVPIHDHVLLLLILGSTPFTTVSKLKCVEILMTGCVSWRDLELLSSIKTTIKDKMSDGIFSNFISHHRSGVKLAHTSTYGVCIPFNVLKDPP